MNDILQGRLLLISRRGLANDEGSDLLGSERDGSGLVVLVEIDLRGLVVPDKSLLDEVALVLVSSQRLLLPLKILPLRREFNDLILLISKVLETDQEGIWTPCFDEGLHQRRQEIQTVGELTALGSRERVGAADGQEDDIGTIVLELD
eukprot:TRINITY_DN5123_c0_g1_i5.p1 TRINITY_DN5123_c0_g1~~TRINITY_DN5123_c0_g1_i5.p1  ORF type:complete len:148 (-),score=14.43 TRINITY_DN5123_c0_g1_i5:184-627(-)